MPSDAPRTKTKEPQDQHRTGHDLIHNGCSSYNGDCNDDNHEGERPCLLNGGITDNQTSNDS